MDGLENEPAATIERCPTPDRYGRDCGKVECPSCHARYRSLREQSSARVRR